MAKDTFQVVLKDTTSINRSNNIQDGLFVEIVGGIVAGIGILIIIFFWKRIVRFFSRFTTRKYLNFNKLKIKNTLEELKRNLKIIVIDDDNIFPVKGFKEFGYSIESWNKITIPRLKQLHNGDFDIIILDIYGVAQDIAERDGLDVLVEIKTKNPAQVIVAYSGQSFDFSKNKFWELADEKLGKPTPFIGTQSIIDNLIERTFTINYHRDKIEKILKENRSEQKLYIVEDLFVKAKMSNSEPDWINSLAILQLRHEDMVKLKAILSKLYQLSTIK